MNRTFNITCISGCCLLLLAFWLPLGAENIYFPQVADGGGYITNFTLVNIGPVGITGRLRFFNQDGTARAVQIGTKSDSVFPLAIPAGGSVRVSTSNSTLSTVSGWASFETFSTTVRGVTTFDQRSENTLITTAGVLAATLSKRVLIPVDVNNTAKTGVAIVNPSTASVSVRLRLFDEIGNELSSNSRNFPEGKQIAQMLPELFSNIGQAFKGSVITEASGDGIAATGLTVKEGLLSALPTIDAPVMDTGLPSAPLVGFIPWVTDQAPGLYVYLVGVGPPQTGGLLPAQNWNQLQSTEIQVSTDPTFATFPKRKSSITGSAPPPTEMIFSTDFPDTYYLRARVTNSFGSSPWVTISRKIP